MGKRFMRLKQMMRLGKPAAVPAADSSAVSAKSLPAIPSTSLEVVTVEITNGTEEVLAAEEASASPPTGCPYHKSSSTAESTPSARVPVPPPDDWIGHGFRSGSRSNDSRSNDSRTTDIAADRVAARRA